ncbi:FkbM family methyltransferase [Gephyromycinifex aptenodytis]|uniref:FkbM family methyltransferase n=1 Tax=Gephyromycinifex aptenodytis TaxID=2716227 RepID=UPI001D02D29E|nr:FkbM family methyltransferase [Gephyromycinifex aptenodytis]
MHTRPPQSIADVRALLSGDGLPTPEAIEVLDIGANPIDGDPPYLPLLQAGLARVTGFEPQPEALQRLTEQAGPHERYLPYALGDGRKHVLSICASSGFSSILEPDPAQLAVLVDFPRLAKVVQRTPVRTHRLDDLPDIERVDYLKIDVQGAEGLIIEHGRRALSEVLAVQIEVNYHRLYLGQPSAGEIDVLLRQIGLVPHQVVATKTWPLAPTPWADPDQEEAHHLVEADLLYVRNPAHLDQLRDTQLLALARCAGLAYGSLGLARSCLSELLSRGSGML